MTAGSSHRGVTRWSFVLRIFCLILIIVAANMLSDWLVDLLKLELTPRTELLIHRIIMFSVIVYALLIAIPFVPGIEIGLALLIMAGPEIAVLVYGCTVLGLGLSFLIGHFLPQSWLTSVLRYLRLARASQLVGQMEGLGTEERLAFLVSRAPSMNIPFILRHRYLALAVALNLPGNILIGGGGGISMMAGLSRLYSVPAFLVTLALAVSPVPLAVLIFGQGILSG